MGWLDRNRSKAEDDKLPARLKGKTPEEIDKALEAADKLRTDLELEQAARRADGEKVVEIQSEFEKVKTQLATIEANKNVKPPDRKVVSAEQILENPDGAITDKVNELNAPLANLTIQNSVLTARMLAQQGLNNADMASSGKTMDGRLFQAWGSEIDVEGQKYRPIQLTTPQAWLGIFYYLKGVHADELRDPETRKKKYNFLEPATSGAPPQGTEEKKNGVEGLTDAEKHVADRMGVTYENYAKRKESMQYVNG